MVYIANYWSDPDFTDMKIYSNTERVELYLNGESIATLKPERDRYSTNLNFPPFSFTPDRFEPGELRAVGYINGEPVAEFVRKTPESPEKISLDVDLSNRDLKAGVNDVVFVYAKITDANGTIVHDAQHEILFSVEGDATLIGDNPFPAEAGIATILLKAGESSGKVSIRVASKYLETAKITVQIK